MSKYDGHSPGPWRRDANDYIYDVNTVNIADVVHPYENDDVMDDANTELIRAAPELLEGYRHLAELELPFHEGGLAHAPDPWCPFCLALARARALGVLTEEGTK